MTPAPDLKAAALAATPGPWEAVDYRDYSGNGEQWYVDTTKAKADIYNDAGDIAPNHTDVDRQRADMQFIAAANPATILALIERLQVAEDAAKDAELLDFVLEKDAFLSRVMADSGSMTYQLMTQDDDENYISLSGQDRFYPSSRAAIDAVIAARRLTP